MNESSTFAKCGAQRAADGENAAEAGEREWTREGERTRVNTCQ